MHRRILALPFEAFVKFRYFLYSKNIIPCYFSHKFVISVGNISFGGTGKTPFVIFLSNFLKKNGISSIILTRGYKRKTKEQKILTQDSISSVSIVEFGDEPYILAKRTQSTIVISKKKFKALPNIEKMLDIQVVIIDDGFQHLKIKRDLDFVLLDRETIENPFVFPFGALREPIEALRRADAIVYNDSVNLPINLIKLFSDKLLIKIKKVIDYFIDIDEKEIPPQMVPSKSTILLSGIGQNSQFFFTIQKMGFTILEHLTFRDHKWYCERDLRYIISRCKKLNCTQIITTEKDFYKLLVFKILFLKAGISLYSTKLDIEISEGIRFLNQLITKIKTFLPKQNNHDLSQ